MPDQERGPRGRVVARRMSIGIACAMSLLRLVGSPKIRVKRVKSPQTLRRTKIYSNFNLTSHVIRYSTPRSLSLFVLRFVPARPRARGPLSSYVARIRRSSTSGSRSDHGLGIGRIVVRTFRPHPPRPEPLCGALSARKPGKTLLRHDDLGVQYELVP